MSEHAKQDPSPESMGISPHLIGKKVFFRRRKVCPLEAVSLDEINYKNIRLISKFISERGRILPSRITSVSAKKQRALSKAIKRARNLALLPFVGQ